VRVGSELERTGSVVGENHVDRSPHVRDTQLEGWHSIAIAAYPSLHLESQHTMASSEAEVPSEPASELNTPQMDAKARREARKARILSSGTDRLARITKTGRGGEAELLYADPPKSTLGGAPASSSTSSIRNDGETLLDQDDDRMTKRAQIALQGGVLPSSDDDPTEIDISQQQRIDASRGGNNPFLMGGQQQEGMPQDLQGMMQMMQKAMMGAGGPPGMDGGANGPGIDMQQQQGAMPFGFPFGPSGPGEAAAPPASTKADVFDSLFNLLRILVFVVFGFSLVYGALSGHAASKLPPVEDTATIARYEHMSMLDRWARLAYERPAHWESRYFGVESFGLPIHGIVSGRSSFYRKLLLNLSSPARLLAFYYTRDRATKLSNHAAKSESKHFRFQFSTDPCPLTPQSRPSPPGFLLKATAYIPNAHIRLLIRTLASYLPLIDGFVNDLAVVVFTIGCTILFAAWKTGLDPAINMGLQEVDTISNLGEKLMQMNDPVMGGVPPLQAAM
jgi:hypothetical protein